MQLFACCTLANFSFCHHKDVRLERPQQRSAAARIFPPYLPLSLQSPDVMKRQAQGGLAVFEKNVDERCIKRGRIRGLEQFAIKLVQYPAAAK